MRRHHNVMVKIIISIRTRHVRPSEDYFRKRHNVIVPDRVTTTPPFLGKPQALALPNALWVGAAPNCAGSSGTLFFRGNVALFALEACQSESESQTAPGGGGVSKAPLDLATYPHSLVLLIRLLLCWDPGYWGVGTANIPTEGAMQQ